MLPQRFRLRKRTEFAYSYKKASFSHTNLITLATFKRTDKLLRIGFSVSKKIGKATVRNRVKRQMRAAIRILLPLCVRGYNLIFIAKAGIEIRSYSDILTQLKILLKKAGLLA